jgi:hypothetical protein
VESFDRLVEQNGNLDDDIQVKIESGHITRQDTLKAGIEALYLQQGKHISNQLNVLEKSCSLVFARTRSCLLEVGCMTILNLSS